MKPPACRRLDWKVGQSIFKSGRSDAPVEINAMRRFSIAFSVLTCTFALPAVAQVPPGCGDKIAVMRGDTLSSIADRCDVTERTLIRLNPNVDGSRDLRVGMELQTRDKAGSGASSALGQLGALAGEAADTVSGVARELGSSVKDFMDKNPEVRQRLERFDRQLRGSESNSVQGTLSVSPMQGAVGDALTVTAQGLPPNTPVIIGAGRPQAAYEVIDQARTGSDGTLQTSIWIPDWAMDNRLAVVVAAQNDEWRIRSKPIDVTGAKL
jgi:hypothetical protein